ncbi:hypothetical protein VNO77_33900 [Canavalia gladiata]|uniref:Uncharacterized protein n=1 Tax=Canavalia gladiata TaxID=3824 RepID=A0AAN9KFB2_CANGL
MSALEAYQSPSFNGSLILKDIFWKLTSNCSLVEMEELCSACGDVHSSHARNNTSTRIFLSHTHAFKRPATFPRPLIFALAFMSLFFIVVALVKDIPDIEGDRKHNIYSFPVLFNPRPVFWTCISLLGIAYGLALFMGATSLYLWSKIITGLGHISLASYLWYHAKSVDIRSKASITSFYTLIWKVKFATL